MARLNLAKLQGIKKALPLDDSGQGEVGEQSSQLMARFSPPVYRPVLRGEKCWRRDDD